jgi:hypothetical protein
LRAKVDDFDSKKINLAMVGMGTPEAAARFKDRYAPNVRLIVDRRKETYRAFGLKRGSVGEIVGPKVWLPGVKALATGQVVRRARQDPYQLGGAALVDTSGDVAYAYRAATSADHPSIDDLLAATR